MIYHICFGWWWYFAGCSWKTCPGKCMTRWAQNQITHSEVQSSWNISSLSNILLQVSETENIRKNLAIERMIVEGCDILLDVNQVFVRQGTLIQVKQCSWNQIISVMLICEGDDDYNEWCMAGSARQSPWRSSGSSLCSSPWEVSDVDNADHEDRDNHRDNPDCFLLWAGKPSASASYSATT